MMRAFSCSSIAQVVVCRVLACAALPRELKLACAALPCADGNSFPN